ncbi:Esa1p-associated factor [Loxospora ochrophaea]|nr:Esa1p-associated factor [Loxospora ochrophaea]
MPPPTQQLYSKDERVLCFHHELLYEAKVLESKISDPTDKKSPPLYRVHYKGWKNTWDDWVNQDRLRKFTDENKELAQNLKKDMDSQRQRAAPKGPPTSSRKKAAGSDLSSTRGSEERHSSVPITGRGQKRGRDYEIEKVGNRLSTTHSSSSPEGIESSSGNDSSKEEEAVTIAASPVSPMFPNLAALNVSSNTVSPGPLSGPAHLEIPPLGRPRIHPKRTQPATTMTTRAAKEPPQPAQPLPPAEFILSKTPPPERRPRKGESLMLRHWPEYPAQLTAFRQDDIHPQLSTLNLYDPGNEAKRQFFKHQDPKLKLMIAGVPRSGALFPLHPPPSPPHSPSTNPTTAPINDHPPNPTKNSPSNPLPLIQEESFHTRPSIRILVPDHLKALLVDDWENVTKNLSLVPLPSKHPVNTILSTYFDEEKGKRRLGSAEADLLEEVVAGVKEYFEKCLGRILLYRFEREQFSEIRHLWEAGMGEWEGKGPGDVYGAEHLCRLFVSMPELIAQTNMDQQSVNRLREELAKMTQWLGKNSGRFFSAEYEAASQDYIEKARGV